MGDVVAIPNRWLSDLDRCIIEDLRVMHRHGGDHALDRAALGIIATAVAILAHERGHRRALARARPGADAARAAIAAHTGEGCGLFRDAVQGKGCC